ncbi:T-complex 11 [Irpex lacteus]|nr:T-complex 11 [Irpex lacteus]
MSIEKPAPSTPAHKPPVFPLGPSVVLPTELYQTLDYVYLLHSLAVNPSSVLPPGKSLLSVLSRPYSQGAGENAELRKRVETMVHKAFWEQTLESLSDPTPSVQLARLKELLRDIRITILPLLPENHPVLTTLSLPLPPTSNVLHAVLSPLREVLQALRSRCAPIHDQQLDHLILLIEDPLDSNLPNVIVEVSRAVLNLCEQMKEDLAQFVMGTMGETQLREAVVQEAIAREKELILQLWGPQRVQELWSDWLDSASPSSPQPNSDAYQRPSSRERFIRRLVNALGTNHAVSCPLPTITVSLDASSTDEPHTEDSSPPSPPNALPPPLLFEKPSLLYLQNYLQALVITAALRALVRIPTTASHPKDASETPERDFEERVWLLLKADIDGEPSADGTKVVNLADEVIRVSHPISKDGVVQNIDPAEEARLRAAVDRTLKPNDPVFMLLFKRLLQAIQARLIKDKDSESATGAVGRQSSPVPRHLQSGRRVPGSPLRTPSRSRLSGSKVVDGSEGDATKLVVKGFEHPVMVGAVSEAVSMLESCINWTERVWGDLLFAERSAL